MRDWNDDIKLGEFAFFEFAKVSNILYSLEFGQQRDMAVMMYRTKVRLTTPIVVQDKQCELSDIEIRTQGEIINLVKRLFRQIAVNGLRYLK
jgi:hypothetical protein